MDGMQALDLHIALECFMRDFWSLEHQEIINNATILAAFRELSGSAAGHDVPHCAVCSRFLTEQL
jgi:hypothetical protein